MERKLFIKKLLALAALPCMACVLVPTIASCSLEIQTGEEITKVKYVYNGSESETFSTEFYKISFSGNNFEYSQTESNVSLYCSEPLKITIEVFNNKSQNISIDFPSLMYLPNDGDVYYDTNGYYSARFTTNSLSTIYYYEFNFINEKSFDFSFNIDNTKTKYTVNFIDKNQNIEVLVSRTKEEVNEIYSDKYNNMLLNDGYVYKTYYGVENLIIQDPKGSSKTNIKSIRVFNASSDWEMGTEIINGIDVLLTQGKYIIEITNKCNDVSINLLEIGSQGTINSFNNYWYSEEGQDVWAKAQGHDPNLYTNDWKEQADQNDINLLIKTCNENDWLLPPSPDQLKNELGAIIGISVGSIVGVGALGLGSKILYSKHRKRLAKKQKEYISKMREQEINE